MSTVDGQFLTFVVRIWIEQTSEEVSGGKWRGHVTHLVDKRRRYVQELDQVTSFIADYLRRSGLEP